MSLHFPSSTGLLSWPSIALATTAHALITMFSFCAPTATLSSCNYALGESAHPGSAKAKPGLGNMCGMSEYAPCVAVAEFHSLHAPGHFEIPNDAMSWGNNPGR